MIRLLYQFPTCLQRLYRGVVWRLKPRDKSSKVAYLTFDDGPVPEVTPRVLDILSRERVHATFFMVADNVYRYPELTERIRREGHALGNHTCHHLKGPRYSTEEYMRDVEAADQVLHTRLFRPPYGRLRYTQKRALLKQGYTIYLWDVLTHDYNACYSVEKMLDVVHRYTRNGSIINFHDSIKSNERMLDCLEQVIPWLKQQGYELRPLPETVEAEN